ncbi:MAG: hypothetical protein AVDCRST_MAG85-1455 [uncultured Solirubrobacteraceae bacterium]|uniref:Uncharacterized protein n=1 Tax=uncultured Solirubrobacteraceae bacterium TaxID=1162706 RepID=A0A6J4SM67_9ACTN|nr:MAG: hypothetical protein AVDCRST_MAG85-1455 [uncultured Solirubrobacteraceae bacterium]
MDAGRTGEAETEALEFDLESFEHLVETPRGHIVRVTGRWRGVQSVLPHPTLVTEDPEKGPLSLAPLPIPGQDAPKVDGTTEWRGSYSIPKDRFTRREGPACRLQAAPGSVYDLPELVLPEAPLQASHKPPPGILPTAYRPAAAAGPGPAAPDEAEAAEPIQTQRFTDLILPAMRSHRRLVLGLIALAVVGAAIGVLVRSPTYTAVTTLVVTPLPRQDVTLSELPELRTGSNPESTIATTAELARSRDVSTLTARRLGRGWTQQRVDRTVVIEPVSGSNNLTVTAVDDDGPRAARIANTFAASAVEVRDQRLRRLANAALTDARAQLAGTADPAGSQAQALELRISALRQILNAKEATLSVSHAADVPASPAGLPPLLAVFLSALAGVVLAAGAAVLLDIVGSRRIGRTQDITAVYPLPVLARIPAVPRRRQLRGRVAASDGRLREPFRSLLLQFEVATGTHTSLMLTSPSNGDGKTTSATGLALAATDAGRDVVLVDLDLRKPDIAARLRAELTHGIEDVVAGHVAVEDALAPVPGNPRLLLLSPLQPVPLSGLGEVSRQIDTIVEQATRLADLVILDTPPVGEISDALTFGRAVDDVLLVARVGRTREAALETARDLLERSELRPAGLVVVGATL